MKMFRFKGGVEDQEAEVRTEGDQDQGQRDLGGQDQGHDHADPDQSDHKLDQDPDHIGTEDRGHIQGLVDVQDLGKGENPYTSLVLVDGLLYLSICFT